jgi:hypothetical protein
VTSLHISLTEIFRERKKQKDREEVWQRLEVAAAANAAKIPASPAVGPHIIRQRLEPGKIDGPLVVFSNNLIGRFLVTAATEVAEPTMDDTNRNDNPESLDILAKEIVGVH